ncbi:methylated-DNA--protein-cysteine methyltransferase [Spirochaetia bacterium]|nr:methylated-DNA--protein-cysteine methyltransferase [Spirochaetia bacterium]
MIIYTGSIHTPLGPMTAATDDSALTGLWFTGQKYYPLDTQAWIPKPDHRIFKAVQSYLDLYFDRKKPTVNFSLTPQGTAFQNAVWDILRKIPYGQTTTYGEIAKCLADTQFADRQTARPADKQSPASSMSAQAVGGAVGHNPISILIPCHRVVGASGSLTGYAGGLDKKRYLLDLEGGLAL